NRFLNAKHALVESGELSGRSWDDYKAACDLCVARLGRNRRVADLGPDDFAAVRVWMAKRWGPVRLGKVIQRVRSIFRYAGANGLIDRPVLYGQGFARPNKKTIRLARAQSGLRRFEAAAHPPQRRDGHPVQDVLLGEHFFELSPGRSRTPRTG